MKATELEPGTVCWTSVKGSWETVTVIQYLHTTASAQESRFSVRAKDGREFVRTNNQLHPAPETV